MSDFFTKFSQNFLLKARLKYLLGQLPEPYKNTDESDLTLHPAGCPDSGVWARVWGHMVGRGSGEGGHTGSGDGWSG